MALAVTLACRAAHADPLDRIRTDLRTGQYERVRKASDALGRRGGPRAAVLAARAEQRLGLLVEARRRLEEASVDASGDLPLRAELMRTARALGDRGAVKALIDRSYEDWEAGRVDKSPAQLVAMAVALRLDNNWDDANETLRAALKAEPKSIEANLEWGDMFLEKHAVKEAEASFREVLARDGSHPDAQVGLARVVLEQTYDVGVAEKAIAAALATNPRHAAALALRGEIALDAEELDAVAAVVTELRRTNPRDPGAAWLAATRALLREDRAGYGREKAARLEARPDDGDFFAATAEALVRHRRYDDARMVAAEGVAVDPGNAACLASLGLTLLRLGDETEGVAILKRAWDHDPYDARTFNLLDLFEKVIPGQYVTVKSEHLTFRIPPAARTAIESVVAPYLEQVYARFVERYGFEPGGPIVFELYADPAHYAIRTVGLPRLGVTAVCFGRVITSQVPTNAAFNWGMVLSHELAHVFAIQLSRSRVPRWFTEGLAELETAHLRPEWQRHGEIALAAALARGTLEPLEKLSQAFVHARDVTAASTAYLHAAVALDFLERRFGFRKIREALDAFGRGEPVAGVLERIAGQPVAALEKAFRTDLAERLAVYKDQFLPAQMARMSPPTGEPRGPRALAETGLLRLRDDDARGARAALAKALLLPGGREEPAVSFLAAELALASGEAASAADELRGLLAKGRDGYDVRLRLAIAAAHVQDRKAAEEHLRRAIALAPTELEPRMMLAQLYGAQDRGRDKLAEEEAILRLEPQTASLAKRVVFESARAGRVDKVAELAPAALFIDPTDADLHAALGRALAAQAKTREAIGPFERALLFGSPDPASVHRALAELYEKLGETAKATAHRKEAVTKASPPAPPKAPAPPPPSR